MASAGVDHGIDHLPDGSLICRKSAGGGAKLLEPCEGEKREGIVEGGVGRDAGYAERRGGRGCEGRTVDGVAATCVAQPEVIEQSWSEGVGFVEDGLLPEYVREAYDSTGADDRAGDQPTAVREWRDG